MIAGAAEVVVDYRHPSLPEARALEALVTDSAQEIARQRVLDVAFDWEELVPGAPMADSVRAAIVSAADSLDLSSMDIASGAGHDAQNMATLAPTGMIFVPSVSGRSHSPAEFTPDADVVRGANVLLGAVLRLAT